MQKILIQPRAKVLKTAHFICDVSTPLPGLPISEMNVKMNTDLAACAEMIGVAMANSSHVAAVIMAAVACHGVEENVDVLALINESMTDLRKLNAASEGKKFEEQKNPIK